MEKVARMNAQERADLFTETAARIGTTPAVVEKDFWVSWVLKRIFEDEVLAPKFVFKGGTSLSKVYKVIQRFSEDIDLILDWRELGFENPLAGRSNTQQSKFNDAMRQNAHEYIAAEILPAIQQLTVGFCTCDIQQDPSSIFIHYSASFHDAYLRPNVRLEIGPFSAWIPFERKRISCYAAEVFPSIFEYPECEVKVISAKRTFWDKATILHHEANRPEHSPQPKGYSRHYYDLARLAQSSIKNEALADLELLASVVELKQRFYPRGWARYDQAKRGTFRLLPESHVLASVATDYRQMRSMFFGEVPEFDSILQALGELESEINRGG